MTTALIGATGRVGSEIVRGVLARGDAVTALVRDPGKARRAARAAGPAVPSDMSTIGMRAIIPGRLMVLCFFRCSVDLEMLSSYADM